MIPATRAGTSESEAAIADKVRRNTERVLEAVKAGNLPPRDACPVVARAEQAMQDDERQPLARFGVSQFQRHVRVLVCSGLEQFRNSAQNQKQGLISRAPGLRSGVTHRWASSVSAQV